LPPANLPCPSRALRSRGNVIVVDRQGEILANLAGSLRKHVLRLILRIQPRRQRCPDSPAGRGPAYILAKRVCWAEIYRKLRGAMGARALDKIL